MKILLIHANRFVFKVTERLPIGEEISTENKEKEFEECLVVFTAVEKEDGINIGQISFKAVNEIEQLMAKINASRIIIYPYAHLSNSLATPSVAIETLKTMERLLKEKNYDVFRAPFGWYKAFDISCKGHPLSELSKEITIDENEAKKIITREEVVKDIGRRLFILTPQGDELHIKIEQIDKSEILNSFPSLKKFIMFEEVKGKQGVPPPSIHAMRRLELVDYEDASDSGHFRFYPKGQLMLKLLEDWAEEIAIKRLGCMQIETPLIYNWNRAEIRSQGESFHERHYLVTVPYEPSKEFVLRFAGDFGLFRMVSDTQLTYRHLPLRLYEYSKSFRYERSGELAGLRRLRGFSMPDIHSFCTDIEQGWLEYQDLYKSYSDLAEATGIEYAIVFRIVEEFYRKYKNHILNLLNYSGKPALIEILSKMKHYWAVKHEFQGIDSVGGACQVCTVQLDVEDAERYGITFVNEKGEKQGCIICHSSIGAIERWVYLVLEEALKMEIPMIPLWLNPIQVRIIPVSDEFIDYSINLANQLNDKKIRIDVDDRSGTVSKKVRWAEEEWIPYILVVGKKEIQSNKLNVRVRGEKIQKVLTVEELIQEINLQTKDKPYRPLSLPKLVSKRPVFVG